MEKQSRRLAFKKPQPQDFAAWNGNSLMLNGESVNDAVAENLRMEATSMAGMHLWRIIHETVLHDARQRIFDKAKTMEDLSFGKAMLHTLSLQEEIIKLVFKTADNREQQKAAAKGMVQSPVKKRSLRSDPLS